MAKNIKPTLKLLFSTYILLCLILILYLNHIQFEIVKNGYFIFWALVISIYFLLFLQGFIYKQNSKAENFLIIELIVLNIVLYGIFQLPFLMYFGADAHFEKNVINYILIYGNINLELNVLSPWPLFHVFGSILTLVIENIYQTMKIGPFILGSLLPVLIYKFFHKIMDVTQFNKEDNDLRLNNVQIVFFATIFFISVYNQFLMSSTFIRQTFAVILIILILYFYFLRFSYNNWDNIIISVILIVLIFAITMTHHFSSLILLLSFSILIISEIYMHKIPRKLQFKMLDNKNKVTLTFLILILIAIVSYWTFVAYLPLITISEFANSLLNPVSTTYSQSMHIDTIKDNILFYGFFILNGISLIILLIQFNKIKKIYPLVLILVACGMVGFMGLFFSKIGLYPDRFLLFGWIFGSLPLIIGIISFKNQKLVRIGFIFIFIFIGFNFYQIDPNIYSNPNEVITQPSLEDYSLINKTNITYGPILAGDSHKQVIADLCGYEGIDTVLSNPKRIIDQLKLGNYYKFIIVSSKYENYVKSNTQFQELSFYHNFTKEIDTNTDYNKIADSNNLSIYALSSK